jgi:hypothetical protein
MDSAKLKEIALSIINDPNEVRKLDDVTSATFLMLSQEMIAEIIGEDMEVAEALRELIFIHRQVMQGVAFEGIQQ